MLTKAPKLTYSEAEIVGLDLAKRWPVITKAEAPTLAEEEWADLVQFVLRRAGEAIAARPEPGA